MWGIWHHWLPSCCGQHFASCQSKHLNQTQAGVCDCRMKRKRRGRLRAAAWWVVVRRKRIKQRTSGMKWTVVEANPSMCNKQSAREDLLSRGEWERCSAYTVCGLEVFQQHSDQSGENGWSSQTDLDSFYSFESPFVSTLTLLVENRMIFEICAYKPIVSQLGLNVKCRQ